jgi:outer membrane receptor protein involved in Fe transport
MFTKIHKIITILGIALILNFLCQAEEEKPIYLEEIVVTATKVEERVKDIPANVTVITKEEIERSNAVGVTDLLRLKTNIIVQDCFANQTFPMVGMRGFDPWGSAYIQTLVDGIPVGFPATGVNEWIYASLEDIERIEIVRGPTSALYGGNAMGGVINIITKRGKGKPKTEVGLSYGSDNAKKYKLSSGREKGIWNYWLGFSRREGDGWRDHTAFHTNDFLMKLGMNVREQSALTFDFSYVDTESEFGAPLTQAQYEADPKQCVPGYEHDCYEHQVIRHNLTYRWQINDQNSIKAILFGSHEDKDCIMTMPWTGTVDYLYDTDSLGSEVQYNLKGDFLGRENSLLAGIFWQRDKIDDKEYNVLGGIRGALTADSSNKRFVWAGYLQDEFQLLKPLVATVGLRLDKVEFNYEDRLNRANSAESSMDEFSPKVGLLYKFTELSSAYLNIGKGFRAPTVSQLFASPPWSNPDLEPETAMNYEIGIRTLLWDRLSFSLAGYWMDVEDEIFISSQNKYENAGETRHKGIELESELMISEELDIFFNYTYQQAQFEDYTTLAGWPPSLVSHAGNDLPFAPENKIGAGVRYHHPIGLSGSFGIDWVDEQYSDEANTKQEMIPSRTVCNLRLDYKKDWFNCYFMVNNLFNKKYYDYRYPGYGIFPMSGRIFMGGISVEF